MSIFFGTRKHAQSTAQVIDPLAGDDVLVAHLYEDLGHDAPRARFPRNLGHSNAADAWRAVDALDALELDDRVRQWHGDR